MEYFGLIPGPATAQARPRAYAGRNGVRVYEPEQCRNYKAYAKSCLAQTRPLGLLDGPIRMVIEVYILKPKSWPKKRCFADTKPDADNLAKTIMDACEGLIYTNDSRVITLLVTKQLTTTEPRVEVHCGEVAEAAEILRGRKPGKDGS